MADNNTVIPLEETSVKAYLDAAISFWRKKNADGIEYAIYYVDAFQSVRMSIFGEALPIPENKVGRDK